MTKRILCYGDSNTWGYASEGQPDGSAYNIRYSYEVRWTGVLQGLLGGAYRVLEEGLNGRTSLWDDPIEPYRNGLTFSGGCALTHAPIDLAVIMLGTNDMKPHISGNSAHAAIGVMRVAEVFERCGCGRCGGVPRILIVSPIAVGHDVVESRFKDDFTHASHLESMKLAALYQQMAQECGYGFLDAARFAQAGADHLHINVEGHTRLAEALVEVIKEML